MRDFTQTFKLTHRRSFRALVRATLLLSFPASASANEHEERESR